MNYRSRWACLPTAPYSPVIIQFRINWVIDDPFFSPMSAKNSKYYLKVWNKICISSFEWFQTSSTQNKYCPFIQKCENKSSYCWFNFFGLHFHSSAVSLHLLHPQIQTPSPPSPCGPSGKPSPPRGRTVVTNPHPRSPKPRFSSVAIVFPPPSPLPLPPSLSESRGCDGSAVSALTGVALWASQPDIRGRPGPLVTLLTTQWMVLNVK